MAVQFVNNPKVGDNVKIEVGNSSDLQIYHDGSNSYIKDSGAGNLVINAGSFVLNNAADTQNMIIGNDGGAVALYNAGTKRLETKSDGVDIIGGLSTSLSLIVGEGINSTSANIEIGKSRTASGFAYIDLVGDTTYTDYGLRIIRGNQGANTNSDIIHRGTGTLQLKTQDAADIFFSTSATERIRIKAGGDVGINITNPNAKLHVDEPSTSVNSLTFGANAGQIFTNENSEFAFGLLNASPYPLYIQGRRHTNQARDISFQGLGGNIGIGTYSPARILHIASSTTAAIQLENTSEADSFIDFKNPSRTFRVGYDDSTDLFKIAVTNFNDNSLVVDSAGNVGIGTASPSSKLHISGISQTGTSTVFRIENDTTNTKFLINSVSGDYNLQFKNAGNSVKVLLNSNGDSYLNGGNVGIGTTSPGNKLHVNSGTTSDIVKFENNNGSMVFGQTTALTSLDLASSNAFRIRQGSEEPMRITSAGTVEVRNSSVPTIQLYNTDTSLGTDQTLGDLDWYQSDPSGDGVGVVAKIRGINSSSFQGEAGLAFHTGGSSSILERMRIDSSGNVGIGTASPSTRLEVSASATTNVDIAHFSNSNDVLKAKFSLDGAGHGVLTLRDSSNNEDVKITTSGDSYFNGGNVGIGTTTPSFPLEVNGGTGDGIKIKAGNSSNDDSFLVANNADSTLFLVDGGGNVGIGTSSPATYLQLGDYPSNNIDITTYPDVPSEHMIHITAPETSGRYGGGISFGENTFTAANITVQDAGGAGALHMLFGTGTSSGVTEKMRITNDGKVGIGTTNPQMALHVSRASSSLSAIGIGQTGSNSARLYMDASNGDFSGGDYMWIGQNNDLSGEIQMTGAAGAFHIKTQPSGTITTRFTVLQNGNIGIGTTSPLSQLTVQSSDSTAYDASVDDGQDGEGATIMAFNTDTTTTNSFSQLLFRNRSSGVAISRIVSLSKASGSTDLAFVTEHSNTKSEKMRITSTGRVGIGLTNPTAPLHVSGTIQSVTGATTIQMYSTGGSGVISQLGFYPLTFLTNSSERMRIEPGGDVGINITNPNAKLHVDEPSTSANSLTFGANAGQIFTNENSEFAFGLLNSGPYPLYIQGRTHTNTARDISFQGLGGNIGIGTHSPSSLLHLSSASSPTLRIVDTTNDVTLLAYAQDSNANIGTGSAHQLQFFTNNSTAMVVNGSQNVGIGLTADVGKLGTVNFGGVRLHIRGSGNIARAALEGTVQATVLMRVSGTTASANSKIKFIQSKGGEYRMGSVDDNGTERTQLSIENNGDTHIEDGSLEVDTADKGLILKSANGNRFRITVDNGGTLTSTQIG